jgi:CheY-like chemotaxis protein
MTTETPNAIVFCPACGARYALAEALLANTDIVVLCTACGKGSKLGDVDPERAAATTDALGLALAESHQPRVVVGHEVPAAARSIADILRRGGFAPVCVRTGDEVLAAVDPTMPSQPAAVVLDVGIPGVLAFEIIEALRASPSPSSSVPVVLLASVYERTRYKRRPNRLYGADAYLELHHVPDRLVEVLQGLLTKTEAVDERQQAPVDRARTAPLRGDVRLVDDEEGARSLARRLLSDVALYHGDEIARGVRSGAPFSGIEDAVAAARDLHRTAGGSSSTFDDELQAFSVRLSTAKAVGGKQIG